MSDVLASQWLIQFGGTTLLALEDWMLDDPDFSWEQQGGSVPVARANYAVQIVYGPNATNTVRFTRLLECADGAAARAALAQHNALLPAGVHDAGFTPRDGDPFTLLGARLLPCRPRIQDGRFLACEYMLIGGALDFSGLSDDATGAGFVFTDDGD